VRRIPGPVVSAVARVEVPAAIWRKHRIAELSHADASVLVGAFEWDWFRDTFAVVGVTAAVLETAARTVARHALRADDAVQLGTALVARAADPELDVFACFDAALMAAARVEGFRSLD
jgi:uncharacterized protein